MIEVLATQDLFRLTNYLKSILIWQQKKCWQSYGWVKFFEIRSDENLIIDEQDSIKFNSTLTAPETKIELSTKAYNDSIHVENEQSLQDLGLDFNDESDDLLKNNQDSDFNDKKLTNIDSITLNRNPNSDNEVTIKKYVDDSIKKSTILRFNQTPQNYLKVSVGNDIYDLTKYNKIHITDTTAIKICNSCGYLLPRRKKICNNRKGIGKLKNFIRATKTSSPTGDSRQTSLPPIADSFLYIETSQNSHGENVFVSFERTGIIQISNITFYNNKFSNLTNDSIKSMGRFRIQFLLEDNTWSTRYSIAKNDRYSDSSTAWTLVDLNFTVWYYGIKLIYDEIDRGHADMCFSNIMITHSVNWMKHVNYFKDLFDSIPDCRKIALLMFLIKNDNDLLNECGFLKNTIYSLNREFKNLLMEQNGEYLEEIKYEEESIIERFPIK